MPSPLKGIHLSVRVPEEVMDKVDRIVLATDRNKSWVVLRALTLYLEGEGGGILQDAAGLEALDRGDSIGFDEAMDEMERLVDEIEVQRAVG
ncbi:MAG: ribbon-helix-helix domain-containing protein [Rhodospirillales bacterium]|nr:ribbon-helix-helix domain-containing protein [Rhodospirillales bacterium]